MHCENRVVSCPGSLDYFDGNEKELCHIKAGMSTYFELKCENYGWQCICFLLCAFRSLKYLRLKISQEGMNQGLQLKVVTNTPRLSITKIKVLLMQKLKSMGFDTCTWFASMSWYAGSRTILIKACSILEITLNFNHQHAYLYLPNYHTGFFSQIVVDFFLRWT